MPVRDHYQNALQEIVLECGIHRNSIGNPNYHIEEYTTFPEVVRYTEYHIGETHDQRSYFGRRNEPHFRYNRYLEGLQAGLIELPRSGRRVSHLDIGCGSGLFSWVLLDWATDNSIELDRIDLYGYDHCPAMISLAERIRDKIWVHIPEYPSLHYYSAPGELSQRFSEDHQEAADCIITMGYVLVQAHSVHEIQIFTQIIDNVVKHLDSLGLVNFILIAVDSIRQRDEFNIGWRLLMKELEQVGILHSQVIHDKVIVGDVKAVELFAG